MTKPLTAIEIGSSTVKVLIGEVEGGKLKAIGAAVVESEGVEKGRIRDARKATACLKEAVKEAERQAKAHCREVFLALGCGAVEVLVSKAVVNIKRADNQVSNGDIKRAVEEARGRELPEDRLYVHYICQGFFVDGQGVKNPLGMQGRQLSVLYHLVHADKETVKKFLAVTRAGGLEVGELLLSSLASGQVVSSQQERQEGCLCVDVGAETSNWVWYHGGLPRALDTLQVGGRHFTSDLARAFRLSIEEAEKLKLRLANSEYYEGEKVWTFNDRKIGDIAVPVRSFEKVLKLRGKELFDLIALQLEQQTTLAEFPTAVILTGGAAQLTELAKQAKLSLKASVKLQCPQFPSVALRKPQYATLIGLMELGINQLLAHSVENSRPTLLGRLLSFLKI